MCIGGVLPRVQTFELVLYMTLIGGKKELIRRKIGSYIIINTYIFIYNDNRL